MRRILVAAFVGSLVMTVLAYVPVVGWVNLLLGLWYFVGGLIAAAVWTYQGDGRQSFLAVGEKPP